MSNITLTSKQRAFLRSKANGLDPIFHVGKSSLTPEMTEGIAEALEKRELIKVGILKNCFDDPKELASIIAERTGSVVVCVMGKKITLFKQKKKDSAFVLPKAKVKE